MSTTPIARPSLRSGRHHALPVHQQKEWARLRKAAYRTGRKFSKDDYVELLRTEDMDLLRRNGHVEWNFISHKFPGLPSVTSSSGSDRSFDSSSDSSPSTSAESSPADFARERRFEFPASDENQPAQDLASVPTEQRKRMAQLGTLSALNDLRSAYTGQGAYFLLVAPNLSLRLRRTRRFPKKRCVSDRDDDAMPVLIVNAPVPPPPRLLHPDGGRHLAASEDEHDSLARLADEMFPAGLEEEEEEDEPDPPSLANNAPQAADRANTGKVPLAMRDTSKVKVQYCGKMDKKCSECGALFYPGEATARADGSYGPCCGYGAVSLPTTYDDFPRSVYELLKWEHPLSADFHRHVRNYNSSLSFASINCNLDRRYTGPGGPYCFRIHGNVYTLFNNGTCAEGVPSYAQLYVVDSEQATGYRMQHPANASIDRDLLQELDEELRRVNPHAQSYQMLREVEDAQMRHEREQAQALRNAGMEIEEPELPSFKLLFKLPRDVDRRRYNIPRANEIAAVFRTEADGSIPPAELIVNSGNGRTYRLSTLSSLVAPFTFPLLFPTGKEGWSPMTPLARQVGNRRHVSRREYLSHQIQVRSDQLGNVIFNPLHYAGKLFQEYVVINYVHVEGDRLAWVRSNQAELRANDYLGLHDKIDEICRQNKVGKNVTVLPATFIGSPRYMQRNYEDAMAVVRRFGKPDLFLTMTCNPSWQEITENLGVKPNGTPVDASTRPDLLARVFYLKLKRLLDDIKGDNSKNRPGCFGKMKTLVYTVEYQKRGLPHVHMLITLDNQSKLKTAAEIDKVISAEIPNQEKDPLLHALVKSNMVSELDEEAVGEGYDNMIQVDPVDQPVVPAAQPVMGNVVAPLISDDEGDGEATDPASGNAPSGCNRTIAPPSKSTLLAWLAYNNANADGRGRTYVEFCSHFRFDKNGGKWVKRGSRHEAKVIGRLFNVSPRDQEVYNLRLLLFYVKGCKNFEDIRTFEDNGVTTIHPTFTAAALARGLIEDDEEHIKTMEEAVTYAIGPRLRRFFVMLLVHCEIKDPKAFWERFQVELAADYTHQSNGDEAKGIALAYADILELLAQNGKSRERDFPDLPAPSIVHDKDAYLPEMEKVLFERMESTLYEDQLDVVRYVKQYLDRGCRGNNCIYVGGLGGSGKTYVYKALYHLIRSHPNGGPVVNMASTRIAATLLLDGRTVHSAFALPIPVFSDSKSKHDSGAAPGYIRQAKAFVLDEVSMCSKFVLECVSRSLAKMHSNDQPFGGTLMIIGGDFRQCMPIKQRALPSELFELSVKRSELWARFKRFTLKCNVRALADPEYAKFAVDVGDGAGMRQNEGEVPLIPEIVSTGDLAQEVYGDLKTRYARMLESQRMDYLAERAILCPLNSEVSHYNEVVLNVLPGDVTTYRSYDLLDVDATAESILYPPELLNTLNPPALPPHELNVKDGCVVMLLRNLNISSGLCNGTRLYVVKAGRKLLDCKILTGPRKGERELIPRIKLNYDGNELPVVFARRQFPVRLAFAMTINKSQGQTLKSVGVDIRNPAFSHGQLYVALSRVRDRHSIKVLTNGPSMRNIVYKPVLF